MGQDPAWREEMESDFKSQDKFLMWGYGGQTCTWLRKGIESGAEHVWEEAWQPPEEEEWRT